MSQANSNNTPLPRPLSAGKTGIVYAEANRRELLASIAGASAAALCVTPVLAGIEADPIYAAIETHRASQQALHVACQVSGKLHGHEPEADAANAATVAASDYFDTATAALTDVIPTTLAGVLALLVYIDEFNRGFHFHSEHHLWPSEEYGSDEVLNVKGRALEMPFAFWIMRNVQHALQSLAVQS